MRVGQRQLSLNALNTFDAVGRRLNMREAAGELAVTPSAVSHQIRALEAGLGVALFDRGRRRLALTAAGERLHGAVREAMEGLASAALQLGDRDFAGTLRVAAPPSFTAQWLAPRLPGFLSAYPDLSLRLHTVVSGDARELDETEVAVVFDGQRFPGRRVEPLVHLEMFPVCAPELVAGRTDLSPGDLAGATLIHEDDGDLWARWFAATGAAQNRSVRAVQMPSAHDALTLAAAGGGFAINDDFMGARMYRTGRLVRPFGTRTFRHGTYSLVVPPHARMSAPAAAFEAFLKSAVVRA